MLSDIELCVIACEVTSETIEKEKLNEMGNRIASLLQNRMGLCPYSLIFCKPDSLPRSKDNSLNIEQIRKRFDTGTLAGLHVCMFVQATTRASTIQSAVSLDGETQDEFLTRIEHADQPSFDRQSSLQVADGNTICPVGVGVGTIDQPTRQDLLQFDTLTRLLIWRVQTHPEQSMYTLVDSRGRASKKISFRKLSLKAAKLVSRYIKQNIQFLKSLGTFPDGKETNSIGDSCFIIISSWKQVCRCMSRLLLRRVRVDPISVCQLRWIAVDRKNFLRSHQTFRSQVYIHYFAA